MEAVYIKKIACITGLLSGTDLTRELNTSATSDWFDAVSYLGKKGHRYYSEPVKYTLAAARSLELASHAPNENGWNYAVFMATNSADRAIRQQVAHDLATPGKTMLGAAGAPNLSVNIPASYLSMKYQCHKPCFTYTGPGDSVFFALWQALCLMRKKQADSALVGQVEYCDGSAEKSGALLWELSTINDKTALSRIELFYCTRGVEGLKGHIDLNSPGGDEPVCLIGQKSSALNTVGTYLSENDQPVEWIHDRRLEQFLLPDLFLYSSLSFLIARKTNFRALVVSNFGHIFYIKLIKGETQ